MSNISTNVENFVKELNKFSGAKFILYEDKLSKFLTSLSANETFYSLIEKCLKGFDFEMEFKRSMNSSRIALPTKAEKLIALVFCILVEVDDKKIDFFKFLKTYFSADNINVSFAKFNEEMIKPFKNAALALCQDSDAEPAQVVVEETKKDDKIGFFAIDMHTKLRNLALSLPKCQMAMPIFDAMKWAIDTSNKELFQSLAYALCFITKNKKFAKMAKQIYIAQYMPKM